MKSDRQLRELRAKTDRDLANLFQRRMERSLRALGAGDLEQAESEYQQSAALLCLTRDLPDGLFQTLRRELTELRAALDERSRAFVLAAG